MKRYRTVNLLFFATTLFFLASCGGNGTEEKASTDTSAAENKSNPAPAVVNTIITTPQSMMVATHKVANFAKWKAGYDAHDSIRLAYGVHSYVVARGFMDSNMVMVTVKVDDMAKAKEFAKAPGLKEAMKKGGVIGAPSIGFATMVYQDTSNLSFDLLRSRTTFAVKDWAAWQKSFEEGKQERTDNGIVVRAYGHSDTDDKKVVLVTALTDTAKAFAYYKSDMLKKRREASGVIGEPVRFLYKVVQRYR